MQDRPVGYAHACDTGIPRPGHVLEVGSCDHRLSSAAQQPLDQRPSARVVELAHDIVEQQQRQRPAAIAKHLAFGQ